jgi:hypothetical protein
MARQAHNRDLAPVLAAAERWINTCLIEDQSILSGKPLWTASLVDEVYHAFVGHPDYGDDDFMTKLKGQMKAASAPVQQLMAEMLWALLLFPSNTKGENQGPTGPHPLGHAWIDTVHREGSRQFYARSAEPIATTRRSQMTMVVTVQ